jgi:hypothetical protein
MAEATTPQPEQARHTPGPWEVELCRDDPDEAFASVDVDEGGPCGGGWQIAKCYSGQEQQPPDDLDEACWVATVANANLIAASPDLLAACEAAVAHFENIPTTREEDPIFAALRAAIAKARGGVA